MTAAKGPEQDRRHFHRIPFATRAILEDARGAHEVALLDLSLRGALIALPKDVPAPAEGQRGSLAVPLSTEARIVMEVSVARLRGDQVGLHCEHIDLESVQHLRRLVELNLGDEALLQRELSALLDPDA